MSDRSDFDISKRLCILVPYRDREQHLAVFGPHILSYFARDKIDAAIPHEIMLVEQADRLPFNRGALINAGFLAVRRGCDYFCAHDVDYLPLWADYSYTPSPTRILWYGAEKVPLGHDSGLAGKHNYESFFGAVTLMPCALFESVNGFSNEYWGWGFEDADLRSRFEAAGHVILKRDGTFRGLRHDHAGFTGKELVKLPRYLRNEALYQRRVAAARGDVRALTAEGLATLKCRAEETAPLTFRYRAREASGGQAMGTIRHLKVDLSPMAHTVPKLDS